MAWSPDCIKGISWLTGGLTEEWLFICTSQGTSAFTYHYLNSYTGFLFLIELIISCPLLYIVLYLQNNYPTWLVTCIFQISQLRSSIRSQQQLIVPKAKLNMGKRAFSVAVPKVWNEVTITLKTSETTAIFRKKTQDIYSKLHFHHKSSVVPCSDNDFYMSLFTIMLNDSVFLSL